MSDVVDRINDEFDDYQEELLLRNKKLKLLVDFSIDDELISLLDEVRGKGLVL